MESRFNRQTVLIVENDQPTLLLYQRTMEQEYEVLGATNMDEVMALLKVHSVDIVVLEPGPLNTLGWALLVELKQSPEFANIPIVLCTTQDERRRGMELGSAVYLTKPALPAILLDTVRGLTRPESTNGG
jgi:DNA-binding response OmpR family regulator